MKRNLPKKLLSLLLSGMLVVTGLDVTTVRAAEPSAAVEAETTSSESQAVAETASSASQNETMTESQAVTEAAADESQAPAESGSDESQTAMESDTDEPQTATESSADESQTATESGADESQTTPESETKESQTATESLTDSETKESQTATEPVTDESQTATDSETEESQTESVTDESQTESETEESESETETETLPSFSLFEVNPLYADLIDASQAEEQFEGKALLAEPREEATCQTLEEAAAHLREKMIVREGTVVINMPSKALLGYNFNTFFNAVFEAAFEYSDACSGQEGDALRWATKTRGLVGTSPDQENYRLVFTITYHSTAAQEEELTAAVNAALSELNLDGKSDYEKVRAIHDYICDHVDYDYSLKKYSAYDALCTGTAVCQGYSVLFYRMCKDAGLSVRIISGTGNGGAHGWNIVRVGDSARAAGQYYNVDCTWDGMDSKTHHAYFLKSDDDLVNHTRDAQYATAEFKAAFPVSDVSYMLSSGKNVPNIRHRIVKYTNTSDIWYSTADKKPKVIALVQATCSRSQATVRDMAATKDFGDVDLYVVYSETANTPGAVDKFTGFVNAHAPNSSHLTFGYSGIEEVEVMKPMVPGGPPVLQWEETSLWDAYMDLAKEHFGWDGQEATPILVYIDANDKVQHMTYGQQSASGIKNNLKAYCSGGSGSEGTSAYIINYVLNGGINHTGNPSAYMSDSDAITLHDPLREGYTFLGWYTDAAMTKPITQITSASTGNLTLYAKWEADAQKPETPSGFPEIDMSLTDGNLLVGITGTYSTETAETILERLNAIRKEACDEGVIDPATNQPLTASDYKPLKWSSDLEAIARLRAAEAALRPAHDRPNGQRCFTVKTTNNEQSFAENLAWNYTDLMAGIEQWYGEKQDWVDKTGKQTGHYESIISTRYNYVAVSAFELSKGYIYPVAVAQEFSDKATMDSQKNEFAGSCMQAIEVAGSAVSKLAFTASSPLSLKTGSSHNLVLNATVGFEAYNQKSNCTGPVQDGAAWTSSDDTIAAVDSKGQITALKDGSVTITATVGNISAELTVEVSENAVDPAPSDTYTITYELNGGTNHADNPATYTADTAAIVLKAPAKDGYTFGGWYRDADFTQSITQIAAGTTGNLTLYAKWTKTQTPENPDDPNKPENPGTPSEPETPSDAEYTVTFNMQGHGSAPQSYTGIKSGALIQKPSDPTASGYRFEGWYKDSSCKTAWNFSTDKVTADTTLYAKWVKTDVPADEDISKYPVDQRKDLKPIAKIADIKAKVYDGTPYRPVVKVTITDNGRQVTLTEGTDYRVLYSNNTEPGTGKVTVRGNGIYKGEITKPFQINKKPLKDLNIITGGMSVDAKTEPPVYVYDGAVELVNGTDYTVSKLTDVKGTSAKATVTAAKNNKYYEGTVTVKLTLYKADADKIINPENVTLSAKSVPFTGKAVTTVVPTVKLGSATLEKNKHYKVQYKDNTKAGTALVIITGKGQYKGKVVKSFTIEPAKSKLTVNKISDKTYNGKLQKPKVTVKDGSKTLKLNRDYIVTYSKNLSAGKATVTITGIGNYAGCTTSGTFTIKPQKISKASVKGSVSKGITLTYSKQPLVEGVDYKLTYGAEKKGKIQVTITGLNKDFTGTITKSLKK